MADNETTTMPNPHARARSTLRAILGLALALVMIAPGLAAQDDGPFADEDPFANDTDPFADSEDPLAGYEEDAKAAADAVLDEERDDGDADEEANTSDDPPPRDESNGIPGFTAVSLVGILALVGYAGRRWC